MQSRYKILIFFTVILALGIITLSFWAVFSDDAMSNLQHTLSLVTAGTSLWYGVFSLFAITIILVVYNILQRHAFRRHKDRSATTTAANVDPALSRPSRPAPAKASASNPMWPELQRMTELLQEKDAAITDLENSLRAKQELLQNRSKESAELKSKVNALTEQLADYRLAKERAENILQRELKKTKIIEETDSVIREPKQGSSGRVQVLERELNEKQELLQTRSRELKAAKSKVNTLRERLTDLGTAKNQAENVLRQQLKKKTELLQTKDATIKELQETLSAKVPALEAQLDEQQKFVASDAKDVEPFDSEGSSAAPVKKRARSLLLQELQKRAELLEAKEALVKELKEQLHATAYALEEARSELRKLATERDAALASGLARNGPAKDRGKASLPVSDRKGMNSKLLELGAAKARAGTSAQSDETKGTVEGKGDEDIFLPNKIQN